MVSELNQMRIMGCSTNRQLNARYTAEDLPLVWLPLQRLEPTVSDRTELSRESTNPSAGPKVRQAVVETTSMLQEAWCLMYL